MKRFLLCLIMFVVGLPHVALGDVGNGLIYIEPEVARIVIERNFAHVASDYSSNYQTNLSDMDILKNVVDEYNKMLQEYDGYVSVDGINRVCDVAFASLKSPDDYGLMLKAIRKMKCINFAKDLISTEIGEKDCLYSIKKIDNSQMRIKYTEKDKTNGFIRKNGTIAWRFLNPGALRDSPYKCVVINTKPNGVFAAFDSYEKGRFAVRWLLENTEKYREKTPREAIPMYAPKHENNTKKYIKDLSALGVNVDKKMSELTEFEWEKLLDAIEQIEGWNDQGEIEEF